MIFPGPSHIAVARKEINAATSPSSATANAIASSSHPPVSLPRNKRYGTILFPEDAPRRRKLSAAQEVIAKTRAQWAAADTSQHDHDHDHAQRLTEASGNNTDQLKAKSNEHAFALVDASRSALRTISWGQDSTRHTPALTPTADKALPSCPSAELGQQPDPPSLRPDSRLNATARPFTARVARGVSAGPSQRGPESARPPAPPAITRDLSSSTALDSVTEEAALMMISAVREDGSIPCGRQGCCDILKDVKALAMHLHIHEMQIKHPRTYTCSACNGKYESARELDMHSCERHRAVTSWKPHARGRPLRLQFSQQLARQIAPWAPIQQGFRRFVGARPERSLSTVDP